MTLISESPILIRDDKIAFSTNLSKYNTSFYRINQAMLITHYGFLVPLNVASMDFLDYFEEGTTALELGERHAKALLVDHRSRVYEIAMTRADSGESVVSRMRILAGFGTRYAKASSPAEEEKALTALDVTDSIEEAVKVLAPNLYVGHSNYVCLSIPAIAEGLRAVKCTEPFPVNHFVTDRDLKIRPRLIDVGMYFVPPKEGTEKK